MWCTFVWNRCEKFGSWLPEFRVWYRISGPRTGWPRHELLTRRKAAAPDPNSIGVRRPGSESDSKRGKKRPPLYSYLWNCYHFKPRTLSNELPSHHLSSVLPGYLSASCVCYMAFNFSRHRINTVFKRCLYNASKILMSSFGMLEFQPPFFTWCGARRSWLRRLTSLSYDSIPAFYFDV